MADTFPKFRAAALHAALAFLNREASIEKACRLIEEWAEQGVGLVAFPETFLSGYPFWILRAMRSLASASKFISGAGPVFRRSRTIPIPVSLTT